MHRWNFTNGKSVEQTERDAKRLFPDRWNKLHLQIIFYGRIQPGPWMVIGKGLHLSPHRSEEPVEKGRGSREQVTLNAS